MGREMKTLKKMTLIVLTVALPGWLGTASTSAHAYSFQSNDWSVQEKGKRPKPDPTPTPNPGPREGGADD
jgi:hypothetical protein